MGAESNGIMRRKDKTGWLEDPLLNLRLMIVDEQFYKGLRDKLYASFDSGASVILYEMGLGYGEILGTNMKKMGSPSVTLIGKFMNLGKDHGWGEFNIPLLQMALSGLRGEVVVELRESFFATSAGETGTTECYIMAGIIAGVSGTLLNKPFACKEEKCLSKGDDRCLFRVKQVKE